MGFRLHRIRFIAIDDPAAWASVSQSVLYVCHAGDCSYSFTRWRTSMRPLLITTLLCPGLYPLILFSHRFLVWKRDTAMPALSQPAGQKLIQSCKAQSRPTYSRPTSSLPSSRHCGSHIYGIDTTVGLGYFRSSRDTCRVYIAQTISVTRVA